MEAAGAATKTPVTIIEILGVVDLGSDVPRFDKKRH